ncbi:4-hydroxythreonine-4-phosphate dehydrogenase PdxA [Marivivens sp. LCG002]|uniref:4-hydroxythreonine-4-phosphate dehydrogenase PdxA n=1 Tax=Marivivens sp. LCG002 TaxID=3051171 RepID=UPI002552DC9E|nr:4-hydroxythreonine-4-phosphate dehydrogenase PdxA [Marivivens sp. LCG002]WIV51885.1 4-hydroxythreonine-4-phosphate dehydrogenase PdxA [Marivivens sp. LCG002]
MTIAISCGEPAGIGPEVAAKAWAALKDELPMLWIGDPSHLPDGTPFVCVDSARDAERLSAKALPVLAMDFGAPVTRGVAQPAHAKGVIAAIETAVGLVQRGECSALCTAPIHKKALADGAGFAYPGHTEFLAALGGVERVVMMLACDELRVVPTTIHIPLEDVPTAFTPELLTDTIRITAKALQSDFGLAAPRIAVAGLNPHAGEGGKMGWQEIRMMQPVLDQLRSEGFDLIGPMPPDTMFHKRAREGYDVAICAYHDQALIPIKTIDFDGGVNVTLGLPFIRTSPDHGTAFGIAGQGIANPDSMIAALRMARKLALSRGAHTG